MEVGARSSNCRDEGAQKFASQISGHHTRFRVENHTDPEWIAPEHLRVDAFLAIHGQLRRGAISAERAEAAWHAVAAAHIATILTIELLPRMRELGDNVSGYDAACVAAAESHQCRLVTADGRLDHAPGLRCEVTLVVPGS
jgi:predicted nucleic acid-binding protein